MEAAGGQILFWNGVRVMGVLAVSRAIGDHCLRPFVIAQPEVSGISLSPLWLFMTGSFTYGCKYWHCLHRVYCHCCTV